MWQEKLRIHKNNAIADLYPFAKLWILALYSVCSMILGTVKVDGYPVYMMGAFIVVPIIVLATGIWNKFITVFKKIVFLCVFIVVVQALLVKGNEIVWSMSVFGLFDLTVYKIGLQTGLNLMFTIFNIGGIFAWFFQCTENKELICACEKKGMSPKAAYVLLSTLQMITVLQQNSKVIMNAQQARGVETQGNLLVRTKAFIPSMIPLILGSISNTEERVLTLESKGFSVQCQKTHIFDVTPSGNEKKAIIVAIIITTLVIVWRVLMWVL
ncbi:energy-coupling factor transporter transmembrane component T [Hydrogenoanaerobacterium sp.]|uniref:energy-coupling factor transporter transmembrane component T n=1 Tax=Hydrogenoanaerobacterium sp. TaxID=2953763 RepID=UPI0028982A50|nr:energy-coupling factor transporter transmembrane component T [Hydrogenoanaerobacterium sp.]